MIIFMCKTGLLSILLGAFSWTMTGYAAPLAEPKGMGSAPSPHGALSACRDNELSAYTSKMVSPHRNCRLDQPTKDRSRSSPQSLHYDLVWGDMLNPSQLTIGDSARCFSKSGGMALNPSKTCILIGAPWLTAVTSIPAFSDTVQSLFEFELSVPEPKRLESSRAISFFRSPGYSGFLGSRLSDKLDSASFTGVKSTMRALDNNGEMPRKFLFTSNDYKIEASDSLTRFVPITTRQIRSMETGDLLSIMFLVLLLPDYRRLSRIVGKVFVRKTNDPFPVMVPVRT